MLASMVALDQNVRGLDVAVHQSHRVRGVERVSDLVDQTGDPNRLEPLLIGDDRREVFVPDQPHRDEQEPALLADSQHGYDVWMLDRGRELRLAQEPRPELRFRRELRSDHLQCDGPLRPELRGAIYDAHPPAAELIPDHVTGKDGPRRKTGHIRRFIPQASPSQYGDLDTPVTGKWAVAAAGHALGFRATGAKNVVAVGGGEVGSAR